MSFSEIGGRQLSKVNIDYSLAMSQHTTLLTRAWEAVSATFALVGGGEGRGQNDHTLLKNKRDKRRGKKAFDCSQ